MSDDCEWVTVSEADSWKFFYRARSCVAVGVAWCTTPNDDDDDDVVDIDELRTERTTTNELNQGASTRCFGKASGARRVNSQVASK